jgi:hypothetical protein
MVTPRHSAAARESLPPAGRVTHHRARAGPQDVALGGWRRAARTHARACCSRVRRTVRARRGWASAAACAGASGWHGRRSGVTACGQDTGGQDGHRDRRKRWHRCAHFCARGAPFAASFRRACPRADNARFRGVLHMPRSPQRVRPGFETASALASFGAAVVLACRRTDAAEEAAAAIRCATFCATILRWRYALPQTCRGGRPHGGAAPRMPHARAPHCPVGSAARAGNTPNVAPAARGCMLQPLSPRMCIFLLARSQRCRAAAAPPVR